MAMILDGASLDPLIDLDMLDILNRATVEERQAIERERRELEEQNEKSEHAVDEIDFLVKKYSYILDNDPEYQEMLRKAAEITPEEYEEMTRRIEEAFRKYQEDNEKTPPSTPSN